MAQPRRLPEPGAPDRRALVSVPDADIDDEPVLDGVQMEDLAIADDRLANGRIERSVLSGVRLIGADASSLVIRASTLERCDLSATILESASLIQNRIDGCKLAGAVLDRAIVRNSVFTECRADVARFQHARLTHVRFERCQLRSAYFNGAHLPGTLFESCDLTGADFSHATITGCDLRRSTIEDIRVAPEQLAGVIVTHDQALYLATLLGLVIRDDEWT